MRLGKSATRETDGLSTKAHVQKRSLVIVVARAAPEIVQLFPLELVLDSLSIRRIPDQRKYGSDSFDKYAPLRDVGVVERGLRLDMSVESNCPTAFVPPYLNAVIPVGVSQ